MFRKVEWLIAWRYLRSKRADGGVSSISIISLIGIALGVFALIATLSVRAGFRSEFVSTILGNEGHGQLHPTIYTEDNNGGQVLGIANYIELVDRVKTVEGVTSAMPIVNGQVMGEFNGRNIIVDVQGVEFSDFERIQSARDTSQQRGDLLDFKGDAIAIGQSMALSLGLQLGDNFTLTSANGVPSAFGSMPRVYTYTVVYIYDSGNNFVDRVRAYIPLEAAQSYFNLEGLASLIDFNVENPEDINDYVQPVGAAAGEGIFVTTWMQNNEGALNGLTTEDRLMYILTGILVLVATFTIAAGLIMLVKNKTGDIAILRTMGFTRRSITRIFFLAGVTLGFLGTMLGVFLGVMFAVFFQPIFNAINWIIGGGALDTWALNVIPNLHAELTWPMVIYSTLLAMGLSVVVTYFPARSASKLDPAEALRHG